jgi:hypothetical protein
MTQAPAAADPGPRSMRRLIAPGWQPSAVLLAAQLIGVLVFPFMDGTVGRAALSLFGLVVLVFAARRPAARPGLVDPAGLVLFLHVLRAHSVHVPRPVRDTR